MRLLIINTGIIALLLCMICIGFLGSLSSNQINLLGIIAERSNPASPKVKAEDSRQNTRDDKYKTSALMANYYLQAVGFFGCGIGIIALGYSAYNEKRKKKS